MSQGIKNTLASATDIVASPGFPHCTDVAMPECIGATENTHGWRHAASLDDTAPPLPFSEQSLERQVLQTQCRRLEAQNYSLSLTAEQLSHSMAVSQPIKT